MGYKNCHHLFFNSLLLQQKGLKTKTFKMNNEQMTLRGTLVGHKGWVTKIATTLAIPEMILSASRDKSLIVWQLTRGEAQYGLPNKRLCGHSHFVSDVVISSDGQFALSGSWDGDLRLWNLNVGVTTVRLSLHRVTRLLNSGTLLDNANTPLLKMDTLTGHLVCNSHPTPTHQSLFHVDGIKLSRYGTLLTAN